jgi:subtilase family serine protease
MKLNVPGFLTIGRFIFGDAQTLAQTPIRRVHRFIYKVVAAAAVLGLTAMTAYAGAPYPTANAPKPVDMGPFISNQAISVTIALKLRHPQDAEALLRELNKPGDPQFHKFLTSDQFDAKFGPTEADVEKVARVSGATD